MSLAAEMRYTVAEISLMGRMCPKTVIEKLKAGEFGQAWDIGTKQRPDYRISASGFNAYWNQRAIFLNESLGIAARTEGELRRKAA